MKRQVIATPLGRVEIVTRGEKLRAVHFTRSKATAGPVRGSAASQLAAYFRGERRAFARSPIDLAECTPFERRVYEATRKVPFGKVATYGQIAAAIGQPQAQRAVGQALGRNPVSIVIPCHRIVAADGLGGFTGGLHQKVRLLRHEGVLR